MYAQETLLMVLFEATKFWGGLSVVLTAATGQDTVLLYVLFLCLEMPILFSV